MQPRKHEDTKKKFSSSCFRAFVACCLRRSIEDFEQFSERGELIRRRINDGAPFLERGLRPILVLETDAPGGIHVDDDRVHRFDVQAHQTPAAAEARAASSTPSTSVAVGLPSAAPPYAYSTFTFASATSRSTGASDPGVFGIEVTITFRSATWW